MSITDLGWFARRLLHGSGWGCMLRVEAHFDESGTNARELTVAGYIFEAERIDRFANEWVSILRKYDLPYFHMVDCAHGNRPFDNIDKSERIRIQMQLMNLIKRYAVNGIVCNISNQKDNVGSSYLEAVKRVLGLTLDWAEKTSLDGKIAYFFEAGANGQGLVDAHFQQIATDPALVAVHRYAGHAFLPKEGNPGVQAADLLAWQYHNFTKKRTKLDLPRLDLRALLRHPHYIDDKCGNLPREIQIQSVSESRSRIETIHYLPRDTADVPGTRLIITSDSPTISGSSNGIILACPNCMRAIAEDITPSDIFSRIVPSDRLILRCYCGQDCVIPRTLPPFLAIA